MLVRVEFSSSGMYNHLVALKRSYVSNFLPPTVVIVLGIVL